MTVMAYPRALKTATLVKNSFYKRSLTALTCLLFASFFAPLMGTDRSDPSDDFCSSWQQRYRDSPPVADDHKNVSYAAGILFLNKFNNELYVLLGCRAKSGEWNIPGGLLEKETDTDLESCAIREVNEELNFTQAEEKIDRSVLLNSNSSSVISRNVVSDVDKPNEFLQFTMFLASFPADKLHLINRTIFHERQNKHEIKEFRWFLLKDILGQMYYQKLRLTPDGVLINDINSNIHVKSIRAQEYISLYPELILILSALWNTQEDLHTWINQRLNGLSSSPLYQNQHLYFLRHNLQDFVLKISNSAEETSTQNNKHSNKILASALSAHQESLRQLREHLRNKFNSRAEHMQSNHTSNETFPYSQTEGFLKIILGNTYVEKNIEKNIRNFFKNFYDPAYQAMFNCPDFSFENFDKNFQKTIIDVVQAEAQTQDFVFYHGLTEELAFFDDFLTELFSQLFHETKETVLRPITKFLKYFPNIASFLMHFDQEKELLPHTPYNYLTGYQRWGLSTNITILNYKHFGSSTFNYFWQSSSESPPPLYRLFGNLLIEFGVPVDKIKLFSTQLYLIFQSHYHILDDEVIESRKKENFNFHKNGRLLQFFVPKALLNDIAYPSVVRGQPLDLRYPTEDVRLTLDNYDSLPKKREISELLMLLRKDPDSLEETLKMNRLLAEKLGQEQPFLEQESSPHRAEFFNNPEKLKYISLVESRLFLGSEYFNTTDLIRIKRYDRFPFEKEKLNAMQMQLQSLVHEIVPACFSRNTSSHDLSSYKLSHYLKYADLYSFLHTKGKRHQIKPNEEKVFFFSITETEEQEEELSIKIAEGDWDYVQSYFSNKRLEEVDNPIQTLTITPLALSLHSSNSHGQTYETYSATIDISRALITPLEYAFKQKNKNDKVIFTLLVLNPEIRDHLIKKYRESIFSFEPWLNSPNSLLIRLANYFYKNNLTLKILQTALGTPPNNIWNSLESSIFSSYGTPARQQLCHYALHQGISLNNMPSIIRHSPLHSPTISEKAHLETVKYSLIRAGETYKVLGDKERDAFIIASMYGYPKVLSFLQSENIDFLYKDKKGLSAISYGAASNRYDVIDFFIDLHSLNLPKDRKVELLFHSALMHGNCAAIQYLATKYNIANFFPQLMTTKGENGKTGYENLVQGFSAPVYDYINSFVSLDHYRDYKRNSLLMFALTSSPFDSLFTKTEQDKLSFIKFLLMRGYDSFESNLSGKSALLLFFNSHDWTTDDDLRDKYLQTFITFMGAAQRHSLLSLVASPKEALNHFSRRTITELIISTCSRKNFEKLDLCFNLPSGRPLLNQFIQNEYGHYLSVIYLFTNRGQFSRTNGHHFKQLEKNYSSTTLIRHSPTAVMKRAYTPQRYLGNFVNNIVDKLSGINDSSKVDFTFVFKDAFQKELAKPVYFPSLLNHKYDLEMRDDDGLTALSVASSLGMTEIVKQLLAANANPLAVDNNGNNALFYAIYINSPEIADLIIQHILNNKPELYPTILNQQNRYGRTAFIEAARIKRLYCLEKLLNTDKQYLASTGKASHEETDDKCYPFSAININAQDQDGDSVLSLAGTLNLDHCQQLQIYLLERGAKVTDKAMMRALDPKHLKEKLVLLLKYGGNINAKNKEGNSLLLYAVLNYLKDPSSSSMQSLEFLLENGADINTKDNDNNTIIMKILSYRIAPMPASFLKANLVDKNNQGQTVFDIAKIYRADKWIQTLLIPAARLQGSEELLKEYSAY